MATYRAEIDEIMAQYNAGKITIDEANKKLDALDGAQDGEYGIGFYLASDRAKGCNAWLDCGIGNPDPVKIEDGKLVGGGHPSYTILYQGKRWHVKSVDDPTLVEGPGVSETVEREVLPDDIDWSRKKEYAGRKEPVRQKTKKGTYDVYYNELGYAVKAVKV